MSDKVAGKTLDATQAREQIFPSHLHADFAAEYNDSHLEQVRQWQVNCLDRRA
jgi:hypothetical protein